MATEFDVYSKDGTPVRAKYLEIHGRPVLDQSGRPYIVPADFDWDTYIDKFERFGLMTTAVSHSATSVLVGIEEKLRFLKNQFRTAWPGSPADIQRTYNGKQGTKKGDFVPAFTAVASFLYGAASAAIGLPQWGALAGGGLQNRWSKVDNSSVDTSGEYWNAPENVPKIKNGWSYYSYGTASPAKDQRVKDDKPAKQTTPWMIPKAPTSGWTPMGGGAPSAEPPNRLGQIEGWRQGAAGQVPRNLLAPNSVPNDFAPATHHSWNSGPASFTASSTLPRRNFLEPQPPSAAGFQESSPFPGLSPGAGSAGRWRSCGPASTPRFSCTPGIET
jgi:hypothetical protein